MTSAIASTVLQAVKALVYDIAKQYVDYIRSCDTNLGLLRTKLRDVRDKKDAMDTKVNEGENRLEEITLEASNWLDDVQKLAKNEELKGVAYKDWETANFVAILMGRRDLKTCISNDSDMREAVIKVLKKLKEEHRLPALGEDTGEEYRETAGEERLRERANEDYKMLFDVAREVMKDAIEEFNLRPENNNSIQEMENIVRVEASSSLSTPNNSVKQVAERLHTTLRKFMEDPNVKKLVPEIEFFKLVLDITLELLTNMAWSMDDNANKNRGCCHHLPTPCYCHDRYKISKAAESMANFIDLYINNRHPDHITLPINPSDLKAIPPRFLEGLDSRTKLVDQILESLRNVEIIRVGVYGMGGTGKTTLAKEVKKRADDDIFGIKVMVEFSNALDTVSIQAAIAESIGLPLHDVTTVTQRATMLYHRLLLPPNKKRILIIFVNVWKTINLDDIGIPSTCTLLLTTTDRGVCKYMGVQDANILEVGLLNKKEARVLFNSKARIKVYDTEYENVVERLLIKCGGLPLAIVTTANSLKDKKLASWEQFADDLQKPSSSQVNSDYQHMYSIFNTSYKFIDVAEKRIFFLLACLAPPGSSMKIKSLMRYGIGLNLFPYNTLSEALTRANIWASELVSSTMLLEGDVVGEIKIHDNMRDFAISVAAKQEQHNFMVGPSFYGLGNEPYEKCTAMSLMKISDYRHLNGVQMNNLQILTLRGDLSTRLVNSFFGQMANLEVLALSNMNFRPSLPISIQKLQKLKTLCIEGCILGDIKQIGKLVNLVVLSLRESFVKELPTQMKSLSNLRLLDLTKCRSDKTPLPLLSADILNKLSKLEELVVDMRVGAVESNSNDEGASDSESNKLPYLKTLEVKVSEISDLAIDSVSIQNIEKFRVCVGNTDLKIVDEKLYRRILSCYKIDMTKPPSGCSWPLGEWLKKADKLTLDQSTKFMNLVPQLDSQGFRDLKFLFVKKCLEVDCIVEPSGTNAPPGTLSNLQTLKLEKLDRLEYVLPLALLPLNLNEIDVSSCAWMEFMFCIAGDETQSIELRFLKELKLVDLCRLKSFLGQRQEPKLVGLPRLRSLPGHLEELKLVHLPRHKSFSGHRQKMKPVHLPRLIFFDAKIVFPSLEVFHLKSCAVQNLWSEEYLRGNIENLKNITIENCERLRSIVVCRESSVTPEIQSSEQKIIFPQLEYLELRELNQFNFFYEGGSKLEFPKLKTLKLYALECMTRFGNESSPSALFHEEIQFPCLEVLEVQNVNAEVSELWTLTAQSNGEIPNPAPMLKYLTLRSTGGLPSIPFKILMNLSSLKLIGCNDTDFLLVERSGSLNTQLEQSTVENSMSLSTLFPQASTESFSEQLRLLPNLNLVCQQIFNGLTDITIVGLNMENVISADVLQGSLQQLQYLRIERCPSIKAIVTNIVSVIEFPRLKRLELMDLFSLSNISSQQEENLVSRGNISSSPQEQPTLRLPLLEVLSIDRCHELQHFWSGIIEAPKLRDLSLTNCDNMKQFLVGDIEGEIQLPSLNIVRIDRCKKMEFISSGPLTAPNLTEASLKQCDIMQNFLPRNQHVNIIIKLPFLVNVVIIGCPRLRQFSVSPLLTPSLTQMRYGDDHLKQQFDDLNAFLEFEHNRGRQ